MARKKSTAIVEAKVEVKMNDNLQAIFEQELAARAGMIRSNLRFHRERGKVITHVRKGLSLDGKSKVDYGVNPVEVLAQKLDISTSYVYKLATFYEMYADNEKFQDLMDKFEDYNFNLTWSHFNCLVHVPDEDTRNELIDKTLEEKLSVRGLHKLLEEQKIVVGEDYQDEAVNSEIVNNPVPSQPATLTSQIVEEYDNQEEEEEEELTIEIDTEASDQSSPSAKTTLKKIISSSGKFGDKLVDLVGDLTIGLNEIHGSSANKDIFKGLSSAVEVLESLQQQIGEYASQVSAIKERLSSERKTKDD